MLSILWINIGQNKLIYIGKERFKVVSYWLMDLIYISWVTHTLICVLMYEFDDLEEETCFPRGPHNRNLKIKLLSLPFELSCSKNADILSHLRS